LVAVAIDVLGGEASVFFSVRVGPTRASGAALANLTTGLLDDAFALGTSEKVCQTVVAASSAGGDVIPPSFHISTEGGNAKAVIQTVIQYSL
jgi:TRAP-type C4-dicarboxylate transport system permease large subunit